jgi:Mg2+ and Co2+ transporter CorA
MNFSNMPELQRENSYFYALSAMALVAAIQLSLFYRYGWLS